jgi:hypothetical protein
MAGGSLLGFDQVQHADSGQEIASLFLAESARGRYDGSLKKD